MGANGLSTLKLALSFNEEEVAKVVALLRGKIMLNLKSNT